MLAFERYRRIWLVSALLLGAVLSGCCSKPWEKFAMPVRPDRSCRTGGASGYDVHIWTCLNQQRVVIYKYTAEMSCAEPQKEVSACSELAPIEQRLGVEVTAGCDPPPVAFRWP